MKKQELTDPNLDVLCLPFSSPSNQRFNEKEIGGMLSVITQL